MNRVENIVAKGEITHQYFKKSATADASQCVCKLERVYINLIITILTA